jgi:hypothetical protein
MKDINTQSAHWPVFYVPMSFLMAVVAMLMMGCSSNHSWSGSDSGALTKSGETDSTDVVQPADPKDPSAQPPSVGPVQPPPNMDPLEYACKSQAPQYQTVDLDFAANSADCAFSQNDNLDRIDGRIQARAEQFRELKLPAKTALCHIRIEASEDNFVAHGNFFVSLNSRLIAASYDLSDRQQSSSSSNLPRWDWSMIKGEVLRPSRHGVHCGPSGQCSWPEVGESGALRMSFQPGLFNSSVARSPSSDLTHRFGLHVGGGVAKSCQHSALKLKITARFVSL